jgi:hypothetical protein
MVFQEESGELETWTFREEKRQERCKRERDTASSSPGGWQRKDNTGVYKNLKNQAAAL